MGDGMRLDGIIPATGRVDGALSGVSVERLLEFISRTALPSPTQWDAPACRWQDDVILGLVPEGASVLDLGCGAGELLCKLRRRKLARVQGVELDLEGVRGCVKRGVPVFQADLDDGLREFSDASFDCVILEETLQTLRRPAEVLSEMLRVGQRGIVSFPNFGWWRVRLELAVTGRMPVTERLPYRWHNTPNIHLFTLRDFLDWSASEGIEVEQGFALADGRVRGLQEDDNLYAEEALLVIRRTG